jgi:hypothetical protein
MRSKQSSRLKPTVPLQNPDHDQNGTADEHDNPVVAHPEEDSTAETETAGPNVTTPTTTMTTTTTPTTSRDQNDAADEHDNPVIADPEEDTTAETETAGPNLTTPTTTTTTSLLVLGVPNSIADKSTSPFSMPSAQLSILPPSHFAHFFLFYARTAHHAETQ